MDITAPIFFSAKLYPRRPALMWIGGGVSYAMLTAAVLSAARHIHDAGVKRGELVGIEIDGAYRHTIVMLALMHLGIGSASLEPGRREAAIEAGISVVIADHVVADDSWRIIRMDDTWFETDAAASEPSGRGFSSLGDIIRIKMTSGTTGRPQAIAVSLQDELRSLGEHRFFDVEGRTLSMFGLSSGVGTRVVLRALQTGGTVCLAGGAQEAYDTIQLCHVERVLASTAQLRDLTRCAKEAGAPLPALKSVVTGGSSISARLISDAQRFLCSNIIVHYASTQAGFVAIAPAALLDGRPGAAGFIVPHVEVECVDDDGQPLPRGELGSLRIKSANTGERAALSSAHLAAGFRDGWFYPGDVGRIDPDGMLIIAGRTSELVNIGGVKIAPDLVDDVLLALPGVRDAAAFGMKTEQGEEELWAAVVSGENPAIQTLIAACREKLGSGAPSVIMRALAIPRNVAGKVLRAKLREEVETLIARNRA